jgi:hypothetical protein
VVVVLVEVDDLAVVSVGVVSVLPPQPAAATTATPSTMANAVLRMTLCFPERFIRVHGFAP